MPLDRTDALKQSISLRTHYLDNQHRIGTNDVYINTYICMDCAFVIKLELHYR